MTYIKPERTLNSAPWVKAILEQGKEAAQRQDWLEVSQQLQQLPRSKAAAIDERFLLSPEDWQKAFNLALKMLIQGDFQHQWEISKIFTLLGNQVVPPLNAFVADKTVAVEVRWFICQILGDFPEQSVILTLVQLLQQSQERELITIAGKTLSKIGDRAIDALVTLLSQPEYRLLAANALSYIRSASTIEPLLAIASDEEAAVRTLAINALGSFHDPRIPPVLIIALADRASIVRKEAAIALGFRPDLCQELDLVKHLQPLLFDLNPEVCSQAAIALGRMQQEEATKALFQVLIAETTPITLKLDLVKALGWSKLALAITYLEQALTNANELITQEIILVLGRNSNRQLRSQSVQVLINFWQQGKSLPLSVRQTLATSLGELRDPLAHPVLAQLATDGDRKVQLHALAAFKKLSGSAIDN